MTAFSFSKAYGMTAYRIGYAVGPAKVIDHMHSILRFSLQACSAVGQRAAHAVLTGDMEPWLKDNIANLERKRDYLVDRLNRIPGIRCNTPKGCYFTFPDVRGLGIPTFQLAEHLLRRGRVAVAPGLRVRPEGRGARARELLLQHGADHRRNEPAGAGARRAACPAPRLRRIRCDSPRRSAVCAPRRGRRSPGGSTSRSGRGGRSGAPSAS